jgi:LmbE family N-acetylglucosaminyl deacetylase
MTKLDILALGAHPDDVEMSCSGTLAAATAAGKTIGVVDFTRGELGTRGTPAIRAAEAAAASKVLGLSARENLACPMGFFVTTGSTSYRLSPPFAATSPKWCSAMPFTTGTPTTAARPSLPAMPAF